MTSVMSPWCHGLEIISCVTFFVSSRYRTRRQYTRRLNDEKENFKKLINHSVKINHYFIVRPDVDQRIGQLSL